MAEVDSMTGKDASGVSREFPTLKPLIERVGALVDPAAGSINAQLAALLAKLITAPATEAKQDAAAELLATVGTRAYASGERVSVTSGSLASNPIAASEVMLHATVRCFVIAGANPTAANTTSIPLEPGEKFHMRITPGDKIAVIRDTADGFLSIIPVAS